MSRQRFFTTKSLKLAIIFTFVHCFLSVMVLYVYTNCVLQNNELQYSDISNKLDLYSIYIPKRVAENALISEVIRSDDISVRGWWMAHEKWVENIECFNEEWGTCVKVFSVSCRVDSVRSIYQWLPLKQNLMIRGFEFSFRVSAEDLQREAPDSLHGSQVLVKLNDGSIEILTLKLPEETHPLLLKTAAYDVPNGYYISSVTVMLCCYGFVGNLQFTDVVLTFRNGVPEGYLQSSLLDNCPEIVFKNLESDQEVKIEMLNLSRQSAINYMHEVTLVTQLSMDRLGILERNLATWKGPVSLAVFISLDTQTSNQDWQRTYIEKKLSRLPDTMQLQVTLVYSKSNISYYPINFLRNLAIKRANTAYIFLVDADFFPAPDFQPKFDMVIRADRQIADKTVWVVPAFEYLESPSSEDLPAKTKEELVDQVLAENSNIQPFRIAESPNSHRLTDYWQWYRAEYPYLVTTFDDKYEPYIIIKKSQHMPLYSESFIGYGMNKVSHTTELFAMKYKFKVLHDLWIIHAPHRATKHSVSFLQNPRKRLENRATRFEFISYLMWKYKIGSCKKLKNN